MVTVSFGVVVRQVVTKSPGGSGVSIIATVVVSDVVAFLESVAVRVRVMVAFWDTNGAVMVVAGEAASWNSMAGLAGCWVHCTVMVSSGSESEAAPDRVELPPSRMVRLAPA